MTQPRAEPPTEEPAQDPADEPPAPSDVPWQRLDPRMLLVHPVRMIGQFLFPLVIGFLGIRASSEHDPVWLAPIIVLGPVALGVLLWATTQYRLTDSQFQQRRGLLNKKRLTARLDRIRSVDLEATLLHRVLGLAQVKIGTGVDDTRIELDSLSVRQAEELRQVLLRRSAVAAPAAVAGEEADGASRPPQPPAETLARIDWSWLRFAPFSLTRMVIVGAAIGVFFQFRDNVPLLDDQHLSRAWQRLLEIALPIVVALLVLGAVAGWLVVSVGGYVLQWWDLHLVREQGHIRLTAGLFTTRSTTVEEARIRGVRLDRPLLLRLVGGAELSTYATGVGSGGVTKVLPPCPRPVAEDVGHRLLDERHGEDAAAALTGPVVAHGPRARRRCHVRRQWATLALAAAAVVLHLAGALSFLPGWVLVAVPLAAALRGVLTAELAYAALGHALTPEHLVSQHGAYTLAREALERDGIIGWVLRQSLFQRRAGLATLVATTAAGSERVEIVDVPLGAAVALAGAATPAVLEGFIERSSAPG